MAKKTQRTLLALHGLWLENFGREILQNKYWLLFQNETWFGICSRRLHFMIHKKCDIANLTLGFSFKQSNDDKRNKSHTSVSRCRINSTCWFILKRFLSESFLCLSMFKIHEGLITSYVLKCYCRFKTRGTPHLNSAAQEGKSLKCCLSLKSLL